MPSRSGLILLSTLAAVIIWVIALFNRSVALRNKVREAWSGIEVQLKRRHDLVPLLVETVKGYQNHEATTLQTLVASRNAAVQANGAAQAGPAETGLSSQLRALFALSEAYPELKADASFRQLSSQLVEIEEQLQFARRYHNGAVRDFNNLIQSFPNNLLAAPFHFREEAFFEVEEAAERSVPNIQLG